MYLKKVIEFAYCYIHTLLMYVEYICLSQNNLDCFQRNQKIYTHLFHHNIMLTNAPPFDP